MQGSLVIRTLFVLTTMLMMGMTASADTWDVTNDFSITNGNPNGAWNYGRGTSTVPFSPFTYAYEYVGDYRWSGWGDGYLTLPLVFYCPDDLLHFGIPAEHVALHPGVGAAIIRWTAPISGLVDIDGQFLIGDIHTMASGIFKNADWALPIWSVPIGIDGGVFDHLQVTVALGDTIDFAVYTHDGDYSYGSTPLEATITTLPVPAPSAFVGLIGLGMTLSGIGFWRRH